MRGRTTISVDSGDLDSSRYLFGTESARFEQEEGGREEEEEEEGCQEEPRHHDVCTMVPVTETHLDLDTRTTRANWGGD